MSAGEISMSRRLVQTVVVSGVVLGILAAGSARALRSEEHTSELQSQ